MGKFSAQSATSPFGVWITIFPEENSPALSRLFHGKEELSGESQAGKKHPPMTLEEGREENQAKVQRWRPGDLF